MAVVALVVLYWHDVTVHLVGRWLNEPDYGHGLLVPFFSGYLLYRSRNERPRDDRVTPLATAVGVALLLIAGAMKVAGVLGLRLLGPYSLLPALAGTVSLMWGLATLRWALPAIGFLFFMVPLPGEIGTMMRGPLQRVATIVSTFCLQTVGIPAVAIGNVIHMTNGAVGVVEACSGLRMLMVFVTLNTAFVLVGRQPLFVKLVIVASAVPIAVVANVFRIVTTGMVHEWVGPEIADRVFHDFAGLLMVPVGIALLFCFVAFLNRVMVVTEESQGPLLVSSSGSQSR